MGNSSGLGKFYVGIEFLYHLLFLNILWFSFTLIGLGICGIGPSTIALYATIRQDLMKKETNDRTTFVFFFKQFKENFWRGNILTFIVLGFCYILLVNYRFTSIQHEFIFQFISGTTIVIAALFVIVFAYYVPLYVHYEMRLFGYLKKAILLTFSQPIPTLINISWIVLIGYLTYKVFPFSMLIAMSGLTYGIMGITYSFFKMNDETVNKEQV